MAIEFPVVIIIIFLFEWLDKYIFAPWESKVVF